MVKKVIALALGLVGSGSAMGSYLLTIFNSSGESLAVSEVEQAKAHELGNVESGYIMSIALKDDVRTGYKIQLSGACLLPIGVNIKENNLLAIDTTSSENIKLLTDGRGYEYYLLVADDKETLLELEQLIVHDDDGQEDSYFVADDKGHLTMLEME